MVDDKLTDSGTDRWLTDVMAALPSVPVPAALEAQILASFDAVAARRNRGFIGFMRGTIGSMRDAVWPGAPAWQPATALALALVIGVAAGALIPFEDAFADNSDQSLALVLDSPPSFDIGENS